MTVQETGGVLDVLRAAYPQFYRNIGDRELKNVLQVWAAFFREEPVELVKRGVSALILADVKGYPPSIGAVKQWVWRVQQPERPTTQQAWLLVQKAVNSADYEKAFQALPAAVRRCVGSPTQLAQWGRMEESAFQSVVYSHFRRAYGQECQYTPNCRPELKCGQSAPESLPEPIAPQ